MGLPHDVELPPLEPDTPTAPSPKDVRLSLMGDIGHDAPAHLRWESNIAALRILKLVEEESRKATPEEQAILARYSGFGDSAFNGAFDKFRRDREDAWGRRGDVLRELLTTEEYQSLEASRLNAFYTSPEIVNSMWSALQRMGVDNLAHPRVLEPSAGSGRFLGYQPVASASRSERTAIELDSLTGRLLKLTYPETAVYVAGYQDAPIINGSIDVAISNVPFGDFPVTDPAFRKNRAKLARRIHNYFFVKTMDKLRPGGVLAFITTHGTLDSPTAQPVREALATQADLIGAIRLPQSAFPDTDVVTDMIFMRKRLPGEIPGDQSWVKSTPVNLQYERYPGFPVSVTVDINQYFVDHPEMVLGTHTVSGTMRRGGEYNVEAREGESLAAGLYTAIQQIPEGVITDVPAFETAPRSVSVATPANTRDNAYVIDKDNVLRVNRGRILTTVEVSEADKARIVGMLEVRDAARGVLDAQLTDEPENVQKSTQSTLNEVYTKYVGEYGSLNSTQNANLMRKDPDGPFLRALEQIPDDDKKITKGTALSPTEASALQTEIFHKRVVRGLGKIEASNAPDALTASLKTKGYLDFEYMGGLIGKEPTTIQEELSQTGHVFKNPVGGWEPADKYLTGNVVDKLKVAKIAASADPSLDVNVEALRIIQPEPLSPSQIGLRMGSPWIPDSDINNFIDHLLPPRYSWRGAASEYFAYEPATGSWLRGGSKINSTDGKVNAEWGTGRMPAPAIIDRLLNGKAIEVTDTLDDGTKVKNPQETFAAQEKATAIQAEFKRWIWDDPDRTERLVEKYNNTFNNLRARSFDGSHQTLPGMREEWAKKLRPHQKDAIWRVVQDGTVLLAHEVGFGKTAVMVAGGMELRRLGLARKNMYVVPKSTHAQFQEQFADLYPYARILAPTQADFHKDKRKEFLSRIVTGDWDAIILTGDQFRRIPIKPETAQRFIKEEIDDLREALYTEAQSSQSTRGESASHKEIQKSLKKAEERLEKAQQDVAEVQEDTMYWEELGVDQLFVDEADRFKNLGYATKMTRVKGLPATRSQRAFDMYAKVRGLQEAGKGRGVVFATGTPISNTIAEMYTSMRYLQPQELETRGLKHFDAWAATFGETTSDIEQTPAGAYRMTTRFAKFQNAPELNNLWQMTTDIRVASEVPGMAKEQPRMINEAGNIGRTVISAPADSHLLAYIKTLATRAENLGPPEPGADNMLKISSDARKASLDMRMVDPLAPENPKGKIVQAAAKISEIHRETMANKGTQLVFLDLGTPKAKDNVEEEPGTITEDDVDVPARMLNDVYSTLRHHLIARGVPADEIAFIHDAKTDVQRKRLFANMNSGKVRVLIGSTEKLGVGVNVQERAAALHHLDAPWKPRDIEQREGRIVRQGNIVYGPKKDDEGEIIDPGKGVRIYQYVTERSFDAFMWQAVEAKSKAIKSIMRRAAPPREVEDIDAMTMSASEAKAIASGNPDVLKAVTLKNELNRLQMLRASHLDAAVKARSEMQAIPARIAHLDESISQLEKDTKLVDLPEDAPFAMTIKGILHDKRPDAGKALAALVKEAPATSDALAGLAVGTHRGMNVSIIDTGPHQGYKIVLINPATRYAHVSSGIPYADLTADGALRRVENTARGIEKTLESSRRGLSDARQNLRSFTERADVPFIHGQQLVDVQAELAEVEARLAGTEKEPAAA